MEPADDTDSNKTEVEEIEMVDMEGRAEYTEYDENTSLLHAARQRMESRGRVSRWLAYLVSMLFSML